MEEEEHSAFLDAIERHQPVQVLTDLVRRKLRYLRYDEEKRTSLLRAMVEQLVASVGSHGFDIDEREMLSTSDGRMTLRHAVKDMSKALRHLYSQQGLWQPIKELDETIHEELCASCGADDQRTLHRLSSLLHACRQSGNLEEAIAVGLKLVAAQRAVCGGTERLSGGRGRTRPYL